MTLDLKTLDRLRALSTSPGNDVLRDVATLFVSQAPRRLAAIRSWAESGNSKSLRLASHSLKGSAATLGAKRLSSLAAELEELAIEDQSHLACALLAPLETECELVCKALGSEAIGNRVEQQRHSERLSIESPTRDVPVGHKP